MKFTYNIVAELQKKPRDSWEFLIDEFPELIKPSVNKPKRLRARIEGTDPNLKRLYNALESCGFELYSVNRKCDFDKSKFYYEVDKRATIEKSDITSADFFRVTAETYYPDAQFFEKVKECNGCVCMNKYFSGKFRHTQGATGLTCIIVKDEVKKAIEESQLVGHHFKPVYLKSKTGIEKSMDMWELISDLILSSINRWESCDFFPPLYQIKRSDLIRFGECDIVTQIDSRPEMGRSKFEPIIVSKNFYNFWQENSFGKLDWDPIYVKEDV